jgi:hypothetical protein
MFFELLVVFNLIFSQPLLPPNQETL